MLESMLDTNVCVRAMRRGGEHIRERLKGESDGLCISTIVLNELYVGAELSQRADFHLELTNELAARLTVLHFDEPAARHAAQIRADLTRKGQLIGPNDLLIAGHARSLGLKLITGNLREFRRVDGLRCEDWL
jgi:tRNA(fMet)-specific endonuclease VapC